MTLSRYMAHVVRPIGEAARTRDLLAWKMLGTDGWGVGWVKASALIQRSALGRGRNWIGGCAAGSISTASPVRRGAVSNHQTAGGGAMRIACMRQNAGRVLSPPNRKGSGNMANRARPKTKAKAAKGKVKGAAIATLPKAARGKKGHNSQMAGLSDAEVKVELGKLDRLYSNWEKDNGVAKQTLNIYRSGLKAAKKNGIDTDAYVAARDKNRADHGKVITQAANEGRYLRIQGSPLATQMHLFQNLEEPAPAIDVALQGQMAGKAAEPSDNNPYTPGSDDWAIWDENHKLGVAQAAKALTKGSGVTLN